MSDESKEYDEKSLEAGHATPNSPSVVRDVTLSTHAPTKLEEFEEDPEKAYIARFARYGVLGVLIGKLFASGVEARGVERVPEDQRSPRKMWNK